MREREAWRQYTEWRRLVFTADLVATGFPRNLLAEDAALGRWLRVCPGVYRRADVTLTYVERIAIVARKHPEAVFCLETALWLSATVLPWEPECVWVALPPGARALEIDALGVHCVWMSASWIAESVRTTSVEQQEVRLFSTAKTAIDCFKFRDRVGIERAVDALYYALELRVAQEELLRLARHGRVEKMVRSHIAAWQRGDWAEDPERDHPDPRLTESCPMVPGARRGRPPQRREQAVFRVGPEVDD